MANMNESSSETHGQSVASENLAALADELLAVTDALVRLDLNRGSAGNVSVRLADGCLITPTGIEYRDCTAADMVKVGFGGTAVSPQLSPHLPFGRRKPSSELPFHLDIYTAYPQAGAIIHAHPPFATALACQRLRIPPFHYMIARFGGDDVRCADYATFGTPALSASILTALQGRRACLIAHHGMVVHGDDLAHALALAVELETLCEQYWRVLQLGEPKLLTAAQMREVIEKFACYGQQEELPDSRQKTG